MPKSRSSTDFLEGDALEVVNNLKQEYCWNRYGQLIEDTRVILNRLQFWDVGHVGREANEAAHCLTKVALEQSMVCIKNIVLTKQEF